MVSEQQGFKVVWYGDGTQGSGVPDEKVEANIEVKLSGSAGRHLF